MQPEQLGKPSRLERSPHNILFPESSLWENKWTSRWLVRSERYDRTKREQVGSPLLRRVGQVSATPPSSFHSQPRLQTLEKVVRPKPYRHMILGFQYKAPYRARQTRGLSTKAMCTSKLVDKVEQPSLNRLQQNVAAFG